MTMKTAVAIVALIGVAALVGCSESSDQGPSKLTTKTPTASPSPASAQHYAALPDDQSIVTTADDQTGAAMLGSYKSKKRSVLVYLTCSGAGQIKIIFKPLGSYPLVCNQTGAGSLNTFELAVGSSYSVSVEGGVGQVWAATIAETDAVD